MTTEFQAHLELLEFFLTQRAEVIERIQALLNAQRKPIEYLQDAAALSRHFEDCFFIGASHPQSRLRRELEDAHWSGGFRPRDIPGLHNGLIDPGEMIVRAFHLWRETRWPGRNGRIRYARTLFDVYVVRTLTLLTMRLWDGKSNDAGERLSRVQRVLDRLWSGAEPDRPVLVRDARWLIPLAQSPATDQLAGYFEVAGKIESLPHNDRIEVHKASAKMAGGHLRSQIRYYCIKRNAPLDDKSVVLSTRNSNALDFALLIQDLVPLLGEYDEACRGGDRQKRLELADAICQGVSPDPELFVNQVELLGAYSMIEHLFITMDGQPAYTAIGVRHVQLLEEYKARISRVANGLYEDCPAFRPAIGAYSPYGVLYGFSSDLIGHMALKASHASDVTRFSLEDVFDGHDNSSAAKLAWVRDWRKLPHLTAEVLKLFEYPQQFAEDVFARIEHALRRRALDEQAGAGTQTGRLLIASEDQPATHSPASTIPDLPVRFVASSDAQVVAAQSAHHCSEAEILADRREAKCLLSYKTSGGWVAISKDILTEILGAGDAVRIAGLPPAAAGVLRLMCPDLSFAEK